jgi:hypothetical protein
MPLRLPLALLPALIGLAACDEIAVADDPVALAEVRGQKSCVAAVANHTGVAAATLNTSLPVVEVDRFIVDVPGGNSWTCVTDERGKALEIVERTRG